MASSYTEAVEAGCVTYFTGRPCRSGHIAERQTANRTCVACKRLADARGYQTHREKRLQWYKEWRLKNPEVHAAKNRAWAAANPEKTAANKRRHAAKPEAKEKNRIASARVRARNPGKCSAWRAVNRERARIHALMSGAKRRTAKIHATPSWADLGAIRRIYEKCARITKETGIRHHVDHEFPLVSDLVCGLHVAANLRVIPATENYKKNNKLPFCNGNGIQDAPPEG